MIGRLKRQLIPFQIYFAADGAPFKTAADLDIFGSKAFDSLVKLLEIWDRAGGRRRPVQAVEDAMEICNLIKRFPFNKKDGANLRSHFRKLRPGSTVEAVSSIGAYDGPALKGKTHLQLHESAEDFVNSPSLAEAIRSVSKSFSGLRFDQERAEEDVWYTDPPLDQLAEIAESDRLSAEDMIDRIEKTQETLAEYRRLDEQTDSGETRGVMERPLHLMTAHRSKGKEFETVVVLDVDDKVWSDGGNEPREVEAERRLFYVAFTRARKRVILMRQTGAVPSPFVRELGLSG